MRVAAVLLLALVLPAGAQAFAVRGGTPSRITSCGAAHVARVLDPGARAAVVGQRRLALQQCRRGRWRTVLRLDRGRNTVSAGVGDFRVRRTRAPRRPRYLRFGVGELVDVPFRVEVDNVNRTAVGCAADGARRTLRGHLTAPRTTLDAAKPAATLYLHGFGYGEFFWRFRAVDGYDTTSVLARAGHASVTIDRAGYGRSRTPADGPATCLGSQADMAHQVVDALKAGTYETDGAAPVAFARVALVGHSAGGLIAELAAGSFPGVDALGIVSYADQGQTPLALMTLGTQALTCAGGGAPGTPGFAPFGATDADFAAAHLNAPTDPAVRDAVLERNAPEPCGDAQSGAAALLAAQGIGATVDGPVLLLSGEEDALFSPGGVQLQRMKFGAANDTVTTEIVPGTGHALLLGRTSATVVDALEAWLETNGF